MIYKVHKFIFQAAFCRTGQVLNTPIRLSQHIRKILQMRTLQLNGPINPNGGPSKKFQFEFGMNSLFLRMAIFLVKK